MPDALTEEDKQLLAVALLLLKDFRGQTIQDPQQPFNDSHALATKVGCLEAFNKTRSNFPAMKIVPK